MAAFARCFAQVHDTRLYSQPVTAAFLVEELVPPEIIVPVALERTMEAEHIPPEWHELDALLIPYGGFGHLQELLPSVRVIQWIIHPDQARSPEVEATWTNSKTTVSRLTESERWADSAPQVVIPPHDMSPFLVSVLPWAERDIDVLCVGSLLHSKRIGVFEHEATQRGWKAMIVGATWPAIADESGEVMADAVKAGIPVKVNLTRREVAQLMGRSKVVASYSEVESAPLIAYEAMAAGAVPCMREAGALREQLGDWSGFVDSTDEEVSERIDAVLRTDCSEGRQAAEMPKRMKHGQRFCASRVGAAAISALDRAVGRAQ
jgi:hypothetical protein